MDEKLENFVNLLHRNRPVPPVAPASGTAALVPAQIERAPSVPPMIPQRVSETVPEAAPRRIGRVLVLVGILIVVLAGAAGLWLRENEPAAVSFVAENDNTPHTTALSPVLPAPTAATTQESSTQIAPPVTTAPARPVPASPTSVVNAPPPQPSAPVAPSNTVAAVPRAAPPVAPRPPETKEAPQSAEAALPAGEATSEETYQPLPDKTATAEQANEQVANVPPPSPPAKGTQPQWVRFALPAPPPSGRPRIAIVIDDLGLDKKRTERAIGLKGPVTMSFLAYASELPQQTEEARRAGHELLVHVPMEPVSRTADMGPNGLAVSLGRDEVLRRLRWDLSRFDGYIGINNHMGSRFTSDPANMETVIGELRARGLLFLDSRTIGNSMGLAIAEKVGVPTAARDVFLDDEVNSTAINARLADVETVARRHGSAIAIGHPHDQTLDALTVWLASLSTRGFELVPLSAVVKERITERSPAHQSG